jgi:hypothetical protein
MFSLWFGALLIVASTLGAALSTTVSPIHLLSTLGTIRDPDMIAATPTDHDPRRLVRPRRLLHLRTMRSHDRRLVR